jgi:hypothetical protein
MVEPTALPYLAASDLPAAPRAASQSAVSWAAIGAGAFVMAAVSLVLLALGSGLGFAAISPWPAARISGLTLAVAAAIWLILTQWLSASVGGYIAGRLRRRWVGTHTHEVFFRDTAHGFITWSVASVVVAATLSTGGLSSFGTVTRAASEVAGQTAKGAMTEAPSADSLYAIDRLLRPAATANSPAAQAADPKPEVARIIATTLSTGTVDDSDRAYLAQLVASRTGIAQDEANKRVDDMMTHIMDAQTKAKAAADTARQAAAQAAIYLALSLAVGAFIASISAALGGRLRDQHP